MSYNEKFWRGTYGDVKPVEVGYSCAHDRMGKLRSGFFRNELEAWSGVLACNQEGIEAAVDRLQRVQADVDDAKADLIARQQRQAQAMRGYEGFRKSHTPEEFKAMAEAVA